ncbi:MAG: bifunctional phosphoglucose/phosphomannose isomerase [Fimbriimonadaceae bacterium]|jgi:glucose/mannose-6-phosphate isomerase|nr:bifunctional phosphoglucose/phosphomannose isomerase [Fimbriimonadaceae bacterium]
MVTLDGLTLPTKNDPTGFNELIQAFPEQCISALGIASKAALPKWNAKPDLVLLTGLGGSAAGGDLVKALFEDQGKTPFLVNRDYFTPSFVNQGTLVFAVSYSGNTEETISAYRDAQKKGASLIVVTSGGKLAEMAREDGYPLIIVPGGQPPRTAMGYMLLPVVYACESLGLIPAQDYEGAFATLFRVKEQYGFEPDEDKNQAKQIARQLSAKVGLLYGTSGWTFALAQRWKGQINENGKEMIFTHVFPELCHNEILGWEGSGAQGVQKWVTVVLSEGSESDRMKARIGLTLEVVERYSEVTMITAPGDSLLSKMLGLAHIGDYLSIYMAILAGRDPAAMEAIETLKKELAKLN